MRVIEFMLWVKPVAKVSQILILGCRSQSFRTYKEKNRKLRLSPLVFSPQVKGFVMDIASTPYPATNWDRLI